jgi:hypothetical protein
MRCARLLSLVLCAGLCACTRDFDAFDFDAPADAKGGSTRDAAVSPASDGDAGPERPGSARRRTVDAGAQQTSDSGTGGVGPGTDAAAATVDGGAVDAGSIVSDAGSVVADAGNAQSDAGSANHDAAVVDAGVADDASVEMCSAAWSGTSLSASACSTCACASCSEPVTACLTLGTEAEVQQCTGVFVCAIQHDCKDWACYCTAEKCGAPSASGDGPCVAEMEAAAGGKRVKVMSILQGGDANEPLVRAVNATGCVLGFDSHSPGGTRAGQCDATCP